ncbi:MAG: hypothetical protein QOF58_3417 [Pseudonocardiales bacterium]|jgi:hypothetical protein|nr:hypothetical protein [Pseudonocardiales bacterium]
MSTSTATPIVPTRDIVLTARDTGEELATIAATVVKVVRKEERGVLAYLASARQKEADPRFGWLIGLEAQLQVATADKPAPDTYFLSRLVDEPYWLLDGHFGPNGVPRFSHSFGERYLNKQRIHTALEALLDEAVRTLGLAAEIGPDIPLVLAAASSDGGAQTPA